MAASPHSLSSTTAGFTTGFHAIFSGTFITMWDELACVGIQIATATVRTGLALVLILWNTTLRILISTSALSSTSATAPTRDTCSALTLGLLLLLLHLLLILVGMRVAKWIRLGTSTRGTSATSGYWNA